MDLVELLSYTDIQNEIILEHLDVKSFLTLQVNKRFQTKIFSHEWFAKSFGNITKFPGVTMNSLYRLLLINNLRNSSLTGDSSLTELKRETGRFGYQGFIGTKYSHQIIVHPHQSLIDKFQSDTSTIIKDFSVTALSETCSIS